MEQTFYKCTIGIHTLLRQFDSKYTQRLKKIRPEAFYLRVRLLCTEGWREKRERVNLNQFQQK